MSGLQSVALMYHDVVVNGNYAASGFPGPAADRYKLDRQEFERHLRAIRDAIGKQPVVLTFDDGGASAYDPVAGMLEELRWRGHFFVVTDWIGRPGFLEAEQIRELDLRGHVVGSHSCSHPARLSHLPWDQIVSEWRDSVERLAQILQHPVEVASVPGGFYSSQVARGAAQAGIRTLFTSEPTTRVQVVDGCRVLGRYVVQRGMGPEWSAGFAAGKALPRFRQALLWKAKQAAKAVGGGLYLRAREAILRKA